MAILRIVRLSLDSQKVNDFIEIFKSSSPKICQFDGCKEVKLMHDFHHENVFYTYSIWESQTHLDFYRSSQFFELTWAKTKKLFDDRPQAFSLEEFEV